MHGPERKHARKSRFTMYSTTSHLVALYRHITYMQLYSVYCTIVRVYTQPHGAEGEAGRNGASSFCQSNSRRGIALSPMPKWSRKRTYSRLTWS